MFDFRQSVDEGWLGWRGSFLRCGLVRGVLIAIALVAGVLVAVELGLRWVLGLGTPPLYVGDEKTGYRLKPDQRIRRFGNRIQINEFSMRGGALAEAGSTLRVLVLGDSIVNGNWWTDQDDTLTERLKLRLRTGVPPRVFEALVNTAEPGEAGRSRPLEVLNISANSWGPRNELGYLEKFGVFNSQALVLVINTDDFFSKPPTSVPVGLDPNYPDQSPGLAWVELLQMVLPSKRDPILNEIEREDGDVIAKNLRAIAQIQAIAMANQMAFMVVITPLKREVVPNTQRDYEKKARERLENLTQDLQIPLVDVLEEFRAVGDPDSLFRDNIHLSIDGNERVAEAIAQRLQGVLVDRI